MRGSTETYVIVVGGGLAGLSASLFLAWQGVPVVMVEKHQESSPHPRAIGYTARTLELLRAVGMGETIRQEPADFRLLRVRVASLAGEWLERSSWTPAAAAVARVAYSPCTGASLAQDRIEPLLRDRAVELGADVRLGTELTAWTQDADGVTAHVKTHDGDAYTVRAAYMIAADGTRSPIRGQLGISMHGRGDMGMMRSVLFRAPLDEYLTSGISQFEIDQPGLKAFLASYNDGRWALMFHDDEERNQNALRTAINAATGRPDLPVEIITTGRWDLSAGIAERFSSRRVFLVGDAAHTLPPSRGGYGANTGIADAHNIAWKLASVQAGRSQPALLESYTDERRPVAWRRHQQIFARPDYKQRAAGYVGDETIIDDDAMEFGQIYRSSVIADASADLPPALRPDQWAGQPGTRAPHFWVQYDGARVSTLDLFQPDWVLLVGGAGWHDALRFATDRLHTTARCLVLGVDVRSEDVDLAVAFGISPHGASLVRPDGYIAWRSHDLPDEAESVLPAALSDALAHGQLRTPAMCIQHSA